MCLQHCESVIHVPTFLEQCSFETNSVLKESNFLKCYFAKSDIIFQSVLMLKDWEVHKTDIICLNVI